MKLLNNSQLEGQIRHILTLVAGILAAFSIIPDDWAADLPPLLMGVVSAVLGVIGFRWSAVSKDKKHFEATKGKR